MNEFGVHILCPYKNYPCKIWKILFTKALCNSNVLNEWNKKPFQDVFFIKLCAKCIYGEIYIRMRNLNIYYSKSI